MSGGLRALVIPGKSQFTQNSVKALSALNFYQHR